MINPRLSEEERNLYIKKASEYERKLKRERERYEKRIKLNKVYTEDNFLAAFKSSREDDKRMALVVCSKTYLKMHLAHIEQN